MIFIKSLLFQCAHQPLPIRHHHTERMYHIFTAAQTVHYTHLTSTADIERG